MATINELTSIDTLSGGDLAVVWNTANGDSRKASLTLLKSFILENFATDLTPSVNAIEDMDDFVIYDVSQSKTVSIDASLVRDYVRTKLFGGTPTAGTVLAGDDKFMYYDATDGFVKTITVDTMIQQMRSNGVELEYITQMASPSATDFNVQITDADDDIHLILTPTTNFTAGTITLPAKANLRDKQKVLVNCTQQVGTLTIDGNGAVAVTGAPASLGADDFFTLKYHAITESWYRVG